MTGSDRCDGLIGSCPTRVCGKPVELDRVALSGSGTAPEPRGVRNTTGVVITSFGGTNGAAPADYDHLIDAVQVLRGGNCEPNAIIQSPRSETTLSKLKEATTNAYLTPPPQLADIPRYTTNQIPGNPTTGTSTDTTEVYVGDWSNLWIGMRTELILGTLTERYAEFGQIAFWYGCEPMRNWPTPKHLMC